MSDLRSELVKIHFLNPLAGKSDKETGYGYFNDDPDCVECGEVWPCRTIKLLAAHPEQSEAEAAELKAVRAEGNHALFADNDVQTMRTEWGVEYTLPDGGGTYISKYAETGQQARELAAESKYPARAVSRQVTEWE